MLPLTWFLFSYGVKAGANAAEKLVSRAASRTRSPAPPRTIGLVVVGAICAQYAKFNIGLVYTSGDLTINIARILDSIFPELPVLIISFVTYWLMVKKNWSAGKTMLLMLVDFHRGLLHYGILTV
jgi:mannose/fructose/N-acetylgalactosamine-specific phosphotransferase system component IID